MSNELTSVIHETKGCLEPEFHEHETKENMYPDFHGHDLKEIIKPELHGHETNERKELGFHDLDLLGSIEPDLHDLKSKKSIQLEFHGHETKESIDPGFHGKNYELEVGKLFLKRVIDMDFEDFKLTREKTGLGKFDDLTLIYTKEGKKYFRLVQIKHIQERKPKLLENKKAQHTKEEMDTRFENNYFRNNEENTKSISHAQLTYDPKSYFLLPKYYSYYLESLDNIHDDADFQDTFLQDLIICTNIGFDKDLKNISLKKLDTEDAIFDKAFDLFKLDIPIEGIRTVFKQNYLTPLQQLAKELLYYVLKDKQISITTLISEESVSLIKSHYSALDESVISFKDKRFREAFLEENLIDDKIKEFREILYNSACELSESLSVLNDEELKCKFNIEKNDEVLRLRETLSIYQSQSELKELLKKYKFKLTGKFNKAENTSYQTFSDIPNDQIDINAVDTKIQAFLEKLVFAVEKNEINLNLVIRNELKSLDGEFNDRIRKWYHEGAEIGREGKFREWIRKRGLIEEAMNKTIRFRGQNIQLRELTIVGKYQFAPQTLLYVLCSKDINVGVELPNLGPVQNYYIDRPLVRQLVELKKEVLFLKIEDIFVISNIGEDKLRSWIPKNEKIHTLHDIRKSSRFIITTTRFEWDDFSSLIMRLKCLHETQTEGYIPQVHWLEHAECKFIWKQTYGSLTNLREYIHRPTDEMEILEFSKKKFPDNLTHNFMIVSALPGMGKSIFLNHVSHLIAKHFHFSWVVKIDLKISCQHLDELNLDCLTLAKTLQFLSQASNLDILSTTLFEHCVENHMPTFLLLDGFDELQTNDQREKVIKFSKLMNLQLCSVWISTRPHLQQDLEDRLSSFAFSLREISKKEQICLLTKFWNKYNDKTEDYATSLITKFYQSIDDLKRIFLGVPLHTEMLATVFQGEVNTKTLCVPTYIDIHYLYKIFIIMKYNVLFYKYCPKFTDGTLDCSMEELLKAPLIKSLDEKHQYVALTSGILFAPEETKNIVKISLHFQFDQILEVGIINKCGNYFYFTHRTYAEYFAACRLAELTKKKFSNPEKYTAAVNFLEKLVFKPGNYFVRYFFDHILANDLYLHRSVLRGLTDVVERADQKEVNEQDAIERTPLYYAIAYRKLNIIHILLNEKEAYVDTHNFYLNYSIRGLCESMLNGYREYENVVKELIEKSDADAITEESRPSVLLAKKILSTLISRKWDEARILLEEEAPATSNFKITSYNSLMVALKSRSPLDIIKLLINAMDMEECNAYTGSTEWFNNLLKNYKYKDICEVVLLVKERGGNLNYQNTECSTYLHSVIEECCTEKNLWIIGLEHGEKIITAQFLLENGVKFNLKNKRGQTPLDLFMSLKEKLYNFLLNWLDDHDVLLILKDVPDDSSYSTEVKKMKSQIFKSVSSIERLLKIVNDLHSAVLNNNTTLVSTYLKEAHHNDWLKVVANYRNEIGQTLFEIAEHKRHSNVLRVLEKHILV